MCPVLIASLYLWPSRPETRRAAHAAGHRTRHRCGFADARDARRAARHLARGGPGRRLAPLRRHHARGAAADRRGPVPRSACCSAGRGPTPSTTAATRATTTRCSRATTARWSTWPRSPRAQTRRREPHRLARGRVQSPARAQGSVPLTRRYGLLEICYPLFFCSSSRAWARCCWSAGSVLAAQRSMSLRFCCAWAPKASTAFSWPSTMAFT